MLKFLNLIFTILLVYLCSCNDSKQDIGELQKNKWILKSVVSDKPVDLKNRGFKSVDIYSQTSACGNDDIFSFSSNNELLIDNNEITCDEPKMKKGFWEMKGLDTLKMALGNGLNPINFAIKSINKRRMVLRANMPFLPDGVDVTYTLMKYNED